MSLSGERETPAIRRFVQQSLLKGQIPPCLARSLVGWERAFDRFLTSEDLPNLNNRVIVRGDDIVVDW